MDFGEAVKLFSSETCLLPELQVKICFAFSKMTVQDDATSFAKTAKENNMHLTYVEFLELVGRVAVAYWECNKEHLEEVPLAKKVEFVID